MEWHITYLICFLFVLLEKKYENYLSQGILRIKDYLNIWVFS